MGVSGRRLTALLVAALAVVVVAGAGAAFAVGRARHHAGTPAGPGSGAAVASAPTGADVATGSPTASPRGSPAPGSSITTASTTRQPGPTSSGGPLSIAISPRAEATAHAQEVEDLLRRYFDAINRHDYDSWLTTVSTSQAKRDRDDWTAGYSTTRDSDVYISDITGTMPKLLVRMQFVSHQAVKYAPTALPATCIRWDVTYQVVDEGTGLRVGNSAQPPSMASCA